VLQGRDISPNLGMGRGQPCSADANIKKRARSFNRALKYGISDATGPEVAQDTSFNPAQAFQPSQHF
jgi:hypothetical protein